MTPKRKAYLKKCSFEEKEIRRCLQLRKEYLRSAKGAATWVKTKGWDNRVALTAVAACKIHIKAYKLALRELTVYKYRNTSYVIEYDGVYCMACSAKLSIPNDNYCPRCGRKVLGKKI